MGYSRLASDLFGMKIRMVDGVFDIGKIYARDTYRRAQTALTTKTAQRIRNFALWGGATYLGYKGTPWIGVPLTGGTLLYTGSVILKEDAGLVKGAIIYVTAIWTFSGGLMYSMQRDADRHMPGKGTRPSIEKSISMPRL